MKKWCLVMMLLSVFVLHAERKPKLAVMEIKDQSATLDESMLVAGSQLLRIHLSSSGKFIVIDKGRQAAALKSMVKEQKKESYKKCYDSNCQIPLGQALSADTILRSSVSELGGTYSLSVEMIDLAKEATVKAAHADFDGTPQGLRAAIGSVAEDITGELASQAKVGAVAPSVIKKHPLKNNKPKPEKVVEKETLPHNFQADDPGKEKKLAHAGSTRRTWAWTASIMGAATLIGGIVMFPLASDANSKGHDAYDKYLSASSQESAVTLRGEVEQYRDDEKMYRTTGVVLCAAGSALISIGVVLFLMRTDEEKRLEKNLDMAFYVNPFSQSVGLTLRY